MERTLIIIKPDAVQRGLIGEIVIRFERRGLRIAGLKLMQIDEAYDTASSGRALKVIITIENEQP